MKKFSIVYTVLILCLLACDTQPKTDLDTPSKGSITIAVDESFKPLIEAEIATFESLYPNTKIMARYVSEGRAFQLLSQDSARLCIGTRLPNESELQIFKNLTIVPRNAKIASDGIALIINKNNTDSTLTINELTQLLSGEINQWSQLNEKSTLGIINVICDNQNSSAVAYLQQKYLAGETNFPKNFYALKGNPEVIHYVKQNPGAIGIIGMSWISDGDDPLSAALKSSIKVLGIQSADEQDLEFYKPYQAYLSLKKYPLIRDLIVVSRESRVGLGSGFTSFLAGDKGQRIILKSGLLPKTMPLRIVGFSNN